MKKILIALVLLPAALSAQSRARNVILFLADAGGTSTLAAASLHGHGAPRQLFIQKMPHIGLSDTTTASQIVSDSAAGMTAIVTGYKTQNGVIAMSASTVRGKQDGELLKTILEYAEERGLSTGVISNDALTGATPASTYAHVNDRGQTAAIFKQIFTPRFGDGVDVMIGGVRPNIAKALAADGADLDTLSRQYSRPILSTIAEVPSDASRAIVLLESSAFDLEEAMRTAHRILSKNRKGYFLMVEADVHTDRMRGGLDRMLEMDKVVASHGEDGRAGHAAGLHRGPLVRRPPAWRPPRRRPCWKDWRPPKRRRRPRSGATSESRHCAWTTATPARRCWSRRRAPAPIGCAATWRTRTSST